MNINELLERATQLHRAGNLPEASRLYAQVLDAEPDHPVALFRKGLLALQSGQPQIALDLIEKAIALSPENNRYLIGLGQALAASQRWNEAAAAYRRALDADPHSADTYSALGFALQSKRDWSGAISAYQAALNLNPELPDAWNNLGNCYQLSGGLAQAEPAYRRALSLRPESGGALSNLATVLQATNRLAEAAEFLSAAVKLEPNAISHQVNLGDLLCRQHKFSEAASVLRAALDRDPTNADAAYNLGNALHALGLPHEAAEQYRHATALRPEFADAFINVGNIHKELGEAKAALIAYQSALRANPGTVAALNNASCLLRALGRLEEAEQILRQGLALHPDDPVLHNNLGNVLKDAGELDQAIDCFRKALDLNPDDAATHSNLVYSLSFQSPRHEPILEECRRWNDRHAEPLSPKFPVHPPARRAGRRIRIGYVSPDFRDHCQSLFTIPLLSHHDRSAFEIFCYSSVERPDDFTRQIQGYADEWRPVRHLDDAAVCDRIRADGIDILVDLTMHMAHGRPGVFTRRPAPIQVAWLAYPGTTGIGAIDYRLSDPRLDPPGFESHYTEQTIRLPDSFWCYDPLTDGPEVNALPASSAGHVTFGCLNNPCKLTDHTLRLWSGVLLALPDAQLVLMSPPGRYRDRLLHRLEMHRITSERIRFVPFQPRAEYLKTYHAIDLGLDTVPYNGHTTSLDSLWMGVPVITRVGQTCVGRGGVSQLFQVGLLDLAAETDEAFVDAALSIASDLPRLGSLRQDLRTRLEQSALMDARRFARNMEAAYRQMLEQHCMQQAA